MTFHWPEQLSVRLHGIRHLLSVSPCRTVDENGVLRGLAYRVQPDCHSRHPPLTPAALLAAATRTDMVRLMLWQFSAALALARAYDGLTLGIRVQVSTPVMQLCLKTAELMACLRDGRGVLALETTGSPGEAGCRAVSRLSEVCPVWLGHAGAGDAGLMTALAAPFSGVVLSSCLLQEVLTVPEGLPMLRAQTAFLSARGRRTVVCGGPETALFQGLKGCGVAGFQENPSGI